MPRPQTDPRIDRLVTGDLAPEQRRALIREFEACSDGWRQLAVAFLEAQCWRESLTEVKTSRLAFRPGIERAIAASLVAIAFGLGLSTRAIEPPKIVALTTPAPPLLEAETSVEPEFALDRPWDESPQPTTLTATDVRRLERMGYQFGLRERLLAMPGEGGETIAVPVRELEVRYVGNPPS